VENPCVRADHQPPAVGDRCDRHDRSIGVETAALSFDESAFSRGDHFACEYSAASDIIRAGSDFDTADTASAKTSAKRPPNG
jgi:hypothetical protein